MKKILYLILIFIFSSLLTASSTLEITIVQSEGTEKIGDRSQRDLPPKQSVNKKGEIVHPTKKEIEKWKEEYLFKIDFYVKIKNVSANNISLMGESNSWGYYNLKFLVGDDGNQLLIQKKVGVWHKNPAEFIFLKRGESIKIPVALNNKIWRNTDILFKKKTVSHTIRAVYEQYDTNQVFNSHSWNGSIISSRYDLGKLIPKHFAKPTKPQRKKTNEEDFDIF